MLASSRPSIVCACRRTSARAACARKRTRCLRPRLALHSRSCGAQSVCMLASQIARANSERVTCTLRSAVSMRPPPGTFFWQRAAASDRPAHSNLGARATSTWHLRAPTCVFPARSLRAECQGCACVDCIFRAAICSPRPLSETELTGSPRNPNRHSTSSQIVSHFPEPRPLSRDRTHIATVRDHAPKQRPQPSSCDGRCVAPCTVAASSPQLYVTRPPGCTRMHNVQLTSPWPRPTSCMAQLCVQLAPPAFCTLRMLHSRFMLQIYVSESCQDGAPVQRPGHDLCSRVRSTPLHACAPPAQQPYFMRI